jgi:imidazolonepropionase-like amidohydrolase
MSMRNLLLALLFATTATAQPIVIRAARVIDGRGHVIEDAAVVVDGAKIVRIVPHASALKDVTIDLGDRTIMPGGVDTHVHIGWHFDAKDGRSHDDETDRNETPQESVLYAAENAVRTIEGGITTVQSLGAPVDKPLRDAIARGTLPGPRILTAIEPIFDDKLTPEALRAAVDKLAGEGADVVKVFASQSIRSGGGPTMSQEQMDAICGEAKKQHLRVAVHAHGPESVRRAVLAGCTSIEHGALIGQPELDLMAAHGTYFDPNIDLVFRNYFEFGRSCTQVSRWAAFASSDWKGFVRAAFPRCWGYRARTPRTDSQSSGMTPMASTKVCTSLAATPAPFSINWPAGGSSPASTIALDSTSATTAITFGSRWRRAIRP